MDLKIPRMAKTKKASKKSKKASQYKRTKGQFAASKRNNDNANFVISFTHAFALGTNNENNFDYPEPYVGASVGSVYAMNIYSLLARSDNFKCFKRMYDQVKINGVQVKMNVANATLNTANTVKTYDIYTAWDRTGLDPLVAPIKYTNDDQKLCDKVGILLDKAIAQYGGVTKLQLNGYQRWTQNKSIYPTNLQEKSFYVNTGDIKEWADHFSPTDFMYPINTANKKPIDGFLALNNTNPAWLVENPSIPWKPTLLIGAFVTGGNLDQSPTEVNSFGHLPTDTKIYFSCEFKVACTFRGLKGNNIV